MSQSDKFAFLAQVEIQYAMLMDLLSKEGDPYSLMPDELVQLVRRCEQSFNWNNCSDFIKGLGKYYDQVKYSDLPEIENIVEITYLTCEQEEKLRQKYRKYIK